MDILFKLLALIGLVDLLIRMFKRKQTHFIVKAIGLFIAVDVLRIILIHSFPNGFTVILGTFGLAIVAYEVVSRLSEWWHQLIAGAITLVIGYFLLLPAFSANGASLLPTLPISAPVMAPSAPQSSVPNSPSTGTSRARHTNRPTAEQCDGYTFEQRRELNCP